MSHREIAERVIGNIVSASAPAVSPDGSQVAFVVRRVDLTENTYVSQVWLGPTDGNEPPRAITSGRSDGQPTWSHDGRWLAFTSRRGAKGSDQESHTTLHLMPIGGPGEVRTITTMPDGIGDLSFSPDDSMIAFTSRTQHERYSAKAIHFFPKRVLHQQ